MTKTYYLNEQLNHCLWGVCVSYKIMSVFVILKIKNVNLKKKY